MSGIYLLSLNKKPGGLLKVLDGDDEVIAVLCLRDIHAELEQMGVAARVVVC
jgi:hypothetical protein